LVLFLQKKNKNLLFLNKKKQKDFYFFAAERWVNRVLSFWLLQGTTLPSGTRSAITRSAMQILPLTTQTAAWDDFVNTHPDATFFHLSAWKTVIHRAFRHRPFYVFAEQDGAIAGILPLFQVKSALFGHRLISSPFCVYGGILAASPEAHQALATHAAWLRTRLLAASVELRYLAPPPETHLPETFLPRPALYATFRRPIAPTDEANLKAIPRKQRAVLRKALETGALTAHTEQNVVVLHRIYARSVRNLGTPVFARRYFKILAETFGPAMDILTVRQNGIAQAAVLNFYFRDQVLPYYGGGTEAARQTGANDVMYWEVMRRAAAKGYKLFDFGRSKAGTGAYAFKKNWGFTPQPLAYRILLGPNQLMPDISPSNPQFGLMIKLWKTLPLPVANTLGPILIRGAG
jgi:FemAB-related protein (PEP-CTERM system-associated)